MGWGGATPGKMFGQPGQPRGGGCYDTSTSHGTPPTDTHKQTPYGVTPGQIFIGTPGLLTPHEPPLLKGWVGYNTSGHYFLCPGVRSGCALSCKSTILLLLLLSSSHS